MLFTAKRSFLLLIFIFLGCTWSFSGYQTGKKTVIPGEGKIYTDLQLSQLGLKQEVFEKAVAGWKVLFHKQVLERPGFLSIADLSQSSTAKRLYVIDMVKQKLMYNTFVAHGRNSGEEFAHAFSNKPDSYQSSLGFYLTGKTYEGSHGLSMKLIGLEKGINDIAEQRGIVMHGAPYVSESFCCRYGRLGRSQGCPAVPEELCAPIVNSIKGGSCLFLYYPDSNYFIKSAYLKNTY